MQHILKSEDIDSVDGVHEKFGKDKGLLVVRPSSLISCKKWYFTIPEGCYALVQCFGKEVTYKGSVVWPSGYHVRPPWYRVSHLITKQVIMYKMPIKQARTKDNVSVNVDLHIVLRVMGDAEKGEDPACVSKFIHELTPRGLEDQLQAAQQEAVRMLTRQLLHMQVYGLLDIRQGRHADTNEEMGESPIVKKPAESRRSKSNRIHPVEETKEEDIDSSENSSASHPLLDKGPTSWQTRRKSSKILSLDSSQEGTTADDDKSEDSNDVLAQLVGSHNQEEVQRANEARQRAALAMDKMLQQLNEQFMPQGVQILDLIVTNVTLPDEILDQMSNKTLIISQNAQQIMNQAFEMQRLEFEEELLTIKQEQEEEREEEKQKGSTAISTLQKQLGILGADMTKQKDVLLAEGEVKALQIIADAQQKVMEENMEAEKCLKQLQAEAEKTAATNDAQTNLYCETRLAEAMLKVAENEAKAAEILNEAEEQISEMLQAKREYDTHALQVNVYDALASNDKVVITSSEGSKANNMMITEAILADKNGDPGKAKVLAELAILRNAHKHFLSDETSPEEKS
mmetsp:Transcript_24089/g.30113  ORF Transcript_24089/g.30113 Transcript_24089/m.30113 type:complete len:570 (+) Transcript_24089:396-2105(+)